MDRFGAEFFPCQRCGMEINDFSCHTPEIGDWHDAYLCEDCCKETSGQTEKKKRKRHKKITRSRVIVTLRAA